METITFRCTACGHVLKIGADKAGRKAKCTKCGQALTIPATSELIQEPALAPGGPAPAAKPEEAGPALGPSDAPAPYKYVDEDDDGQKTYGIKQEEPEAAKAAGPKPVVPPPPGRRKGKRLAKITNAKQWYRVGLGMQLIAAGILVWL